jgi:hypothetical protein
MTTQKFIDCERKRFEKLINFRLPHKFFLVGIVLSGLSIIMMFFRGTVIEGDSEWLKLLLEKTLLIGLLIMSISKDKMEDEMLLQLRAQSYTIAFVVGVFYALIMPYIEYGVSNVVNNGGEVYKDLGDFQVLLFMLMIQLMFYHNLKRYR